MPVPPSAAAPRRLRLLAPLGGAATAVLVGLLAFALAAPATPGTTGAAAPVETQASLDLSATTTNPVTPGNFTGYGFDQCETQSQKKMDAWLKHSPYRAVGIYISGASRFCREQRRLTPTWVRTQLAKGWRILPITLGPQSTCVGRFPRYGKYIDPTISNSRADGYRAAFKQGKREAKSAVAAARALGIVPRSTLWYDLEGWGNYKDATCRESALSFLSGWTKKTRKLNYVSGVYSSAGSGMRILDHARKQRRSDVILPDRIWIARWDGKANTSTGYIAEDGWRPGNRMKQYRGGHNETWGGVTINIDSNYLDLRDKGAAPRSSCGTLSSYSKITPKKSEPKQMWMLKCRLKEQGLYTGKMGKKYNKKIRKSIHAWQSRSRQKVKNNWTKKNWATLLAAR